VLSLIVRVNIETKFGKELRVDLAKTADDLAKMDNQNENERGRGRGASEKK
jgi:hypothetical protein